MSYSHIYAKIQRQFMSSQKNSPDQIVSAEWVIPVVPKGTVLRDHAIVIQEGRIKDILPIDEADKRFPELNRNHLSGQALLPGFVNTHTHSPMTLLRGCGEDLPLQDWLNDYIWPIEGKIMSEEFVRDGALLACAEMIRSGTTCFNDMYFYPEIVADVCTQINMRANLSFPVLEFPSAWAQNADEYIHKGLKLHDDLKLNQLVSTAFGPHAPYTVDNTTLEKIATYAEELDMNIHIHLHENAQEVEDYKKAHGLSPIEKYNELGLLTPRLQAVHMTHVTPHEIELIINNGVHIVHCPESNMKLASGICPVELFSKTNVALGTDGCASNNDLDMIGEMKSAGLLNKVSTRNAASLNAEDLLSMATINGAKALGLEQAIGSLETNKLADFISIDLRELETRPSYNIISNIVYSASKMQISNAWIQGKQVMRERILTNIDLSALQTKIIKWQTKISSQL